MSFPEHHHGMTQRAAGESRPGPEPEGTSVRAIVLVAAGLAAAVAISMVAVWLLESPMGRGRPNPAEPETSTPWARDWVHPGTELREVMARSHARLSVTEWLDREAGIARIDIETAMRLLAEQAAPPPPENRAPPPSRGSEAPELNDRHESEARNEGASAGAREEDPLDIQQPKPAAHRNPDSSFILHPSSFRP